MKIVGSGSLLCQGFIELTNINPCSGQEGTQKKERVTYEVKTKIQTQIKTAMRSTSTLLFYSDLVFLEIIKFSAA